MGAPGWLSQLSVQPLILAQVMISQLVRSSPHIGLCAVSRKPALDSLSPSLSSTCPLVLSLSQKQINILKKERERDYDWP